MGGTGSWVRGMGTWHHPLFTGPPLFFQKERTGPAHGTRPLETWMNGRVDAMASSKEPSKLQTKKLA